MWRSLVAQAICNRQVVGSNPSTGSEEGTDEDGRPICFAIEILPGLRAAGQRRRYGDWRRPWRGLHGGRGSDRRGPLQPAEGRNFGKRSFSKLYCTVHGSPFDYGLVVNPATTSLIVTAVLFFVVVQLLNALRRRLGLDAITSLPKKPCPAGQTEIDFRTRRCPACTEVLEGNWRELATRRKLRPSNTPHPSDRRWIPRPRHEQRRPSRAVRSNNSADISRRCVRGLD